MGTYASIREITLEARVRELEVALIHAGGILNPASGFLKKASGVRAEHLRYVQAAVGKALGVNYD